VEAFVDAHFFVSGHIHQGGNVPNGRMKLNEQCNIVEYETEHIQLGTFKRRGEWDSSLEMGVPIRGGYLLEFIPTREKIEYRLERIK
jgi:hypothetical protein